MSTPDNELQPLHQQQQPKFEFADVEKPEDASPCDGVPAPQQVGGVVVITTPEPTVAHYIPSCISTLLCNVFGLVCTLTCFNSAYGKAGAAAGLAVHTIKGTVVCLCAIVVLSHIHTPSFHPVGLAKEECQEMHGMWVDRAAVTYYMPGFEGQYPPKSVDQALKSVEGQHIAAELHDAMKVCVCSPFYGPTLDYYGNVWCVKSETQWAFKAAMFLLLTAALLRIRAVYLRDAPVQQQVTAFVQPAYPTEGIVVHPAV